VRSQASYQKMNNKTDYFWSPESKNKLKKFFDGKHSSEQIAKEFNKSYDTVSKYADRLIKREDLTPVKQQRQRKEFSVEDKLLFGEAIKLYGTTWDLVSQHVGTKSLTQVRAHFYANKKTLEKEPSKTQNY